PFGEVGNTIAPGRACSVRRLPDDARRCLAGQRSHQRHQDRPMGSGCIAFGGQRARQTFRADGRRLPARACIGCQRPRPSFAGVPSRSASASP
nr:hypothetical protein [Tanacetum cinerariifolium]